MSEVETIKKEQIKPTKKTAAKSTKKPTGKPKNKAGAKGKFAEWISEDGLLKIGGWAKDGLNDAQIADNIGISPKTLIEWKKRFPELCESIKENKEIINRKVENAIVKSALGYNVKVKKCFKVKHVVYENGKRVSEDEEVVTAEEEMHVPANVAAQIFLLCNGMPDKYKNYKQIGLTGGKGDGGPVEITWADNEPGGGDEDAKA